MATSGYKKLRVSDFSLQGATEEITSDVVLPNSRIKSKGDAGTQSSSGSMSTEFFPDEIDDFLLASLLDSDSSLPATLGSTQTYFTFIKEYYQGSAPVYQVFTGVQVGQLQLTFEISSKVKVDLSLNGVDNPDILVSGSEYTKVKGYCNGATSYNTKSYNTLKGAISITASDGEFTGDFSALVKSCSLSVNQNPESTGALFQTKAIDSSLGDEVIDGSLDIWNTQDNAVVGLRNSAKQWVDGVQVEITLAENLEDKTDDKKYTISMRVSLKTPSETKDGNKLSFSIPYQVYDSDGLTISKTVVD